MPAGVAPDHRTFGRFPGDIAERFGEKDALVFEGRRISYRELESSTRDFARALIAAGVVKGTRVGVLLANRPEWVVAVLGVGMAGGIAVPLSTLATPSERWHVLRHSDTALLVMQDRLLHHDYQSDLAAAHPAVVAGPPGRIRSNELPFLRRVVTLGASTGSSQSWDEFVEGGYDVSDDLLDAVIDEVLPTDDALVIYTSGTTALPKGVRHTHRTVVGQSWRWAGQMGLSPADRVWSPHPFFWTAGFAMVLGGTLASGATLFVEEAFDAARALELFERERITTIHTFPYTDAILAGHPDLARRDLGPLVNVRAGSSLGKALDIEPREDGWDLSAGYGSTETFTVVTALSSECPLSERVASHGEPVAGMEVRVVDPESGAELPPAACGEILVRGRNLMLGLYKTPPEETFDPDGWYHTQDAGSIDSDGRLHWQGRISGMIKTGGANVSPVEVESRAAETGLLGVVTVVGVPHPTLGEAVVMCAVPLEGVGPDLSSVLAHLRRELAPYKVPKRMVLAADTAIAFTASDKVRTDEARQLAMRSIIEAGDDGEWVANLGAMTADNLN